MGASLSSFLLYFLGIVAVIVGGAGIALLYQTTGMRLHRPRIKPISCDDLPSYLIPVYESTAEQLMALGFEPLHYAQSQDVIVHEHDTRWCMVMVNRETRVFAEIAPATTFLAMPGVEVDFWSIAKTGKVLLTMNAKSHTLLGAIPGAQIHDPLKETLPEQYQAHLEQQQVFRVSNKLALPSSAVFIKLQQKLLDAYFLDLIKHKTIVSTGNNQFRIAISKSISLTGRFLKGETLIQRLLRTRSQRHSGHQPVQAEMQHSGSSLSDQGNSAAESYFNTSQYPVDAEVYAYLRLQSTNESRTTGMVGKVLIFIVTLVISYFAFGLAFSFNSVFILLAVILLHELGHIITMHIFKYHDLQILFLPLLGAASTGKNDNVAVWKQVIVYLMGPLPGIILGLVLIMLNKNWGAPLVYETATIMLVINYVNLLPIVPMDGGHIVRLTIMERFPTGKLIFLGLSIGAFAAGGYFLSSPVFWVLALVMLAAFPMARTESSVLKILHQQGGNIESLDVRGRLRKVFEALKLPQFHKLNFSGKYNLVRSLSEVILQQRQCSLHTAMSLTGVYLAVLLLTPPAIVVSTIGLDNTSSKLKITQQKVPAKDWDAEILNTTDSHERFELLIQASQYYSATTDLYKSGNYLKKAESMANSLNDEEMIARVDHTYALYYEGRGEYAKAESYLEQAIDIGMRRSEKNYLQIATHFQALAGLKYKQKKMKDYESDLITALLFAKKIQTPDQRYIIGSILSQLLDYYYQNRQLDVIQVLLQQTLKNFNKKDSAPFTTYIVKFTHRELGWYYTSKGDYKNAVNHYKKAMALLRRGKKGSSARSTDPMEKTNLLLDIAVAQYKAGNLVIAEDDLNAAIQLVKKNNFDSIDEYIDTYFPSNDSPENKTSNIIGLKLKTGDTPVDANSGTREMARWQMIRHMSHDLSQPATASSAAN